MKRFFSLLLSLLIITLMISCAENKGGAADGDETRGYRPISPEAAKQMMTDYPGAVILDVRTAEEYNGGHIPGAIVLDYEDVRAKAHVVLPDKEQIILVYCRSGRRSKIAAEDLAELGYTEVYEFGGIIDWPYETE
ncbi:MAG: rhodanese-like domain-containing protein [Clostridia bacterium]|nr:rhodanese-like domain-containing protein [Clostridia bacterium]